MDQQTTQPNLQTNQEPQPNSLEEDPVEEKKLWPKNKKLVIIISIIVGVLIIGLVGYLALLKINQSETEIPTQIQNQEQKKETEDKIDTSNWQTYRNEEYGFEFKYSAEYFVSQNTNGSIIISIYDSSDPKRTSSLGLIGTMSISINKEAQLLDIISNIESQGHENFKKSKVLFSTSSGTAEGTLITYIGAYAREKHFNYFIEKNNSVYEIFHSNKSAFGKIVRSFKFTENTSDNPVDYDVVLKNIGKEIRLYSGQYETTDVFLKNPKTGEEILFLNLSDVYSNHYHSTEYHNGNLYIIRRIGYDGYPDKNWIDELWKYDIYGNGIKIYSNKGIDFRVSGDQKIVAIGSQEKIIFLNLKNLEQLKEFSVEELTTTDGKKYRNDPSISLKEWTSNSDFFWGYLNLGPTPIIFFSINKNNWDISKFDVGDLSIGTFWAINSETKDIIYNDYPVMFDVDTVEEFEKSGKKVTNYIDNLVSKKQKVITSDEVESLITEWTNNKIIIKR